MNRRGQAISEMVIILPLLLMLAAGAMSVVYMCLQGIKVQQAANLAARIQGQENVAGGVSLQSIAADNGTSGTRGDPDLANLDPQQLRDFMKARQTVHLFRSGVYGTIQKAVKALFGTQEQDGISIPIPQYGLVGYSQQVKVQRVIAPPDFFGLSINPIVMEGKAYGGEDPHMYGLVRWGSTANNSSAGSKKFWADSATLSNPKQD